MAMTREQRSAAAKLGWERRKARQAAAEAAKARRSAAARKGWETRRKRQMAREMEREWLKEQEDRERELQEEQERLEEQIDEVTDITEGEMIDMQLMEILANGEGGRALAEALINALNALKAEIGEEQYHKNISANADLILDRAEKIVYKYEYSEKTTYAQAIYSAASGGGLIPDDILIEVYDAANTDRRKQYGQTHSGAKQRGPYNKKR